MDVFSHGLWAGIVSKTIKRNWKKNIKTRFFVFWGIFPDLFAFSFSFIWLFYNLIFNRSNGNIVSEIQEAEPAKQDTLFIFRLTAVLYNFSHSLVIFFFIFFVLYFIFRRPLWEMGGWLLHILIDIPTHSYQFYPTPFLWPISNWKFNGFSWGTPWFIILNYSLIILFYLLLFKRKKNTDNARKLF